MKRQCPVMTANNKGPVWRNQALQEPSSPDTQRADSVPALPKWLTHHAYLESVIKHFQ